MTAIGSIRRRLWWDDAACRHCHPSLFFPAGPTVAAEQVHRALSICNRCPVRGMCLADNLDERFGIWGGTTEESRRQLRRNLRTKAVLIAVNG